MNNPDGLSRINGRIHNTDGKKRRGRRLPSRARCRRTAPSASRRPAASAGAASQGPSASSTAGEPGAPSYGSLAVRSEACAFSWPRTLRRPSGRTSAGSEPQRRRPILQIGPNGSRSMRMNDRLLRRQEVEELTGLSRASIYRWMGSGEFPRSVRVGSKAVRWKESDITAWIQSRPPAAS